MMNLFEPWILLRLLAGVLALALCTRASFTALRVLRNFDVQRVSEGQLALEKQLALATTLVRVGLWVQVLALLLTVYTAARLRHSMRGAMCAYGVFAANEWGFRALTMTIAAALLAAVLGQLVALDARMRKPLLARVLAIGVLCMFPVVALDFALTVAFLLNLDLSVVVTCCSLEIEEKVASVANGGATPHHFVAVVGPIAMIFALASTAWAARRSGLWSFAVAGIAASVALPLALGFAVLETAPHMYEVPQHTCPFCLLLPDAYGLGYALFPCLFLGFVWGVSGALAALCLKGATGGEGQEEWQSFAAACSRKSALAWGAALLLAAIPVLRYAWHSGHLITSL